MPKYKSRDERLIEKEYNLILDSIVKTLGNEITYNTDLHKNGLELFGNKFKGVYSSDKIPKLSKLQPYAIINLDKSSQPGSHWIAVAYSNKNDGIVVYDSFGRKSKKIIPSIYNVFNKVIDTDYDAEQQLKEDNCGQRALAWLVIFDKYGVENALLL